jgi:hypothetical protein
MNRTEEDVYANEYPDVCSRIKAALERWERFDRERRVPDQEREQAVR